jgi:hypothetical protein
MERGTYPRSFAFNQGDFMRPKLISLLLIVALLMLGITSSAQETTPEPMPEATPEATPQIIQIAPPATGDAVMYAYTYHQASGNRFVEGTSTFPNVFAVDVPLADVAPQWIVGMTSPDSITRWQVVDERGLAWQLIITPEGIQRVPPPDTSRPASAIPVLAANANQSGNLRSFDNPTRLTHPIPLADNITLQVTYNGDVAIWRNEFELDRLALNALLDARPVVSSDGLIAVYVNATDQRYVHGIMGDDIEGASLAILAVRDDQLIEVTRVDLTGEDIYEGLSPMWADINQDGRDDLFTTVSNGATGARIRAYLLVGEDENVRVVSEVDSLPIGQGNRWRHQLAWGQFAPDGGYALVDVLTPHIGGVVEFFVYTGTSLEIVAQRAGYTSHIINSRNLDMVVAGDFDGDGTPEIVVPTQDRTALAGIALTTEGAVEAWTVPLDGQVISNLSAVNLPDGRLALAAGRSDGVVRVYLPN